MVQPQGTLKIKRKNTINRRPGFNLPSVIGHRGAAGIAPENTLAAIRAAAECGVKWVEFDVKLASDGVAIVLHDDDLERTTNGQGPVQGQSLSDLKALDAGNWFRPRFQGEQVPSLKEALDLLGVLELGANLELKPGPGRESETAKVVAEILSSFWPDHLPGPVVSSFSDEALREMQSAAPQFGRALLSHRLAPDWRKRARDLGCNAVHCGWQHLTRTQAMAVISGGYQLRCYTVNNPIVGDRLFSWGVESIITDHPERFTID